MLSGRETGGSIVSPGMRCGITGLRPTCGRVLSAGRLLRLEVFVKLNCLTHRHQECIGQSRSAESFCPKARGPTKKSLTCEAAMKKSLAQLMYALCVCSLAFVAGCGSSNNVMLTFPSASQAIDNGQSITITVTVKDAKNAGVTWTISSGPGTLSNQMPTTVTYTANGAGTAMITATSKTDPKKFAVDTVTVNAVPSISTTQAQLNSSPATAGNAYTFTFAATGGSGTLTWSATGLPSWLSISAAGVLSGTPPAGTTGPFNFTVTVTDSSAAGAQSMTSGQLTLTVKPAPVLSITKTHVGNFTRGQTGATYTVTVSNGAAAGSTIGTTVTVTETVPAGLTLVSMAGTGWTCASGGTTCTRSDVLAPASSYPAITVTVNVSATAASPQVNQVSVSGGGSVNPANASDSTTIVAPILTIAKTHTGSFNLGQQGATYTVTVSNIGSAPTSGTVTVTETAPSGETLVSMAGTGWTCASGGTTCTRSDALANGSSYPPITVTVNVRATATSPQVNSVMVSGGLSASATATDSTIILFPALGITKTHTGSFNLGQTAATYTVTVSNTGAAPTVGTVTVTDTVPSGETLVSMAGLGWTCGTPNAANVCTRTDALANASSYPQITVTVNVAANATSPQVNRVSVSGGGSVNPANASDPTTILLPILAVIKTHTGNFNQGQTAAMYTVTVSNTGAAPTVGTVTVTDTVSSGLTLLNMAGVGWTCGNPNAANVCTRSDALANASSYPNIIVMVNVSSSASTPQTNSVVVSGGGSVNPANASDPTTIVEPVLAITKTHTGNFNQGQSGATYTVTVSNTGTASTSGTVTVTDTLPSGETLGSLGLAGTGWACVTNSCMRADPLVAGSSYPPITVTVNVAANATTPQTNKVDVSGGGSVAASASDMTTIIEPVLAITKTHTGNFTQGQLNATYTVTVDNKNGTGPTDGTTVTVTDTVPSGLTLVSMAGTGWTCPSGGTTCTRADSLPIGSSYQPITVTVNVGNSATSPQVNSVTVSGGGSASASTTDSTTINAVSVAFVGNTFTTIQAGATAVTVTASVTNDIGSQGVTWTLTAGGIACSPTCGSLSGATTTSVTYTPPASVPSSPNNNPTITATSKADAAKSASFSFTITGSSTLTCPLTLGGQESLLSGTYALLADGWNDGLGMGQEAASIIANGIGGITGGVVDSNGVGTTPKVNVTITSGCYTIGVGGRGKIIFNLSGSGNTLILSIVMRADGKNGDFIEFDDTTGTTGGRRSGTIRKQDTTLFVASTLSGAWAFGVRGSKADGSRAGSLGAFSLDGVSTLSGGATDYSEPNISFTNLAATGSFTAPDATHGRGTLTLTIMSVPTIGNLTIHFAYYITRGAGGTQPIVNLQSTDPPDSMGHALLNGIMVKQIGGPFSNASLNGTVIFRLTGFDTSHTITNTIVGLATSAGTGLFSGVADQEADAAPLTNQAISGTISIPTANGLGTVQITAPAAQVPTSIVMVAPNTALMLEGNATMAGQDVQTGLLLPQTMPTGGFNTASIANTFIFGSDDPATTATSVDVGTIAITSNSPSPGTFTITQDSSGTGGLQSNQVMTGTYTMATNGRGDITITSGGSGTAVIYLFNVNQAVVMPRGGGNITIFNLEQ